MVAVDSFQVSEFAFPECVFATYRGRKDRSSLPLAETCFLLFIYAPKLRNAWLGCGANMHVMQQPLVYRPFGAG
jgi:hypothetical protein